MILNGKLVLMEVNYYGFSCESVDLNVSVKILELLLVK